MNESQIVDYCVKSTAHYLTFSDHCEPVSYKGQSKSHCVGYARLCASLCNEAFRANDIDAEARPVVGTVTCWGLSLCWVVSQVLSFDHRWYNFTKDHDFTQINYHGQTTYVDACAYDIINNDLKTKFHEIYNQ